MGSYPVKSGPIQLVNEWEGILFFEMGGGESKCDQDRENEDRVFYRPIPLYNPIWYPKEVSWCV